MYTKEVDKEENDEEDDLAAEHARRERQRLALEHKRQRLEQHPKKVIPAVQVEKHL